MACQEMLDNGLSAIATNQSQFAVQSVAIPRGAGVNVQELGGMRFVSFTPQNVPGGGKPEPLQLSATSPETFKFIDVLKILHKLGLDRTDKVKVGSDQGTVEVSPRDVVAACLPNPATLGPNMKGKTCAGLWVTGTGKDGKPRSTYLYHVVDNEWAMAEYGHQCVVWQTAINPVVALELLANGTWSGVGILGPECFEPVPFLELLTAYGSPWGQMELPA
jgi:saccharopine dehydrogenase-like NADP-dependent oxidoreductase